MRSVIRRHSNAAELALLLLILSIVMFLAWGLSASANSQRNRVPPGPKPGVKYGKFNHASHSSKCAQCHKVADGERETDFPKHNSCDDCHFFPAFAAAAKPYCAVCHANGNNAKLKRFPEQREDQFSIKFPHGDHVGMDVKDYNPIQPVSFNEEEQKIQAVAIKNGCINCHVKDGPKLKEADYSSPAHPECAKCHGTEGKKVAPAMNNCVGCHEKPAKRDELANIVPNFRHDRDHERDIRPGAKPKAMLDCKFCHNTAMRAKKLTDIQIPEVDKCLACHNEKVGARNLTPKEMAKLKPATTPAPTATPAKDSKPATDKPADKPADKPTTEKPETPK